MAERKQTSRVDGIRSEMRKVQWPNKEETVQYTGIVLLIAALVGLASWILDLVYGGLLGLII